MNKRLVIFTGQEVLHEQELVGGLRGAATRTDVHLLAEKFSRKRGGETIYVAEVYARAVTPTLPTRFEHLSAVED